MRFPYRVSNKHVLELVEFVVLTIINIFLQLTKNRDMYFKTTITYVIIMLAFSKREHNLAAQDKYSWVFMKKREHFLRVLSLLCLFDVGYIY